MGEVYNFPKQVFIKQFLDTLYMATKDNETINCFTFIKELCWKVRGSAQVCGQSPDW